MKNLNLVMLASLFALGTTAVTHAGQISQGERMRSENGSIVEVTSIRQCPPKDAAPKEESDELFMYLPYDLESEWEVTAAMSCKLKKTLESSVASFQLGMAAGSAVAACLGVTPQGAALYGTYQIAGIVVATAGFLVAQFPCEDLESEAALQLQMKRTVCQTLNSKGFDCDPNE